jgi:hypothetical protein
MVYRYRLYLEDGSEAGEAHYAVPDPAGGRRFTGATSASCAYSTSSRSRMRRASKSGCSG